ncbi:protein of unknown function [Taphrina deformans PYCC 5710]|uniref:Homeobox domain-containing protein n=1 Tax=Taphrina deformans (strain PYCC 5710 / ATCC 11124 / CBS 356.35 / IMI 108563 / JCM 9778 / NBRC 8474) TaxID=1097556 RepID=R4XDA5_TAPDE|nr:protein of unknown function [Taphrina deformans PYCC 5710]|eukprot:CCG83573.1 protein of unknown function [Taphrina deformans PYCC 5710]
MDEPTRRRRRTTTLELEILENEFAKCDKPSISERDRISDLINRTDVDGPGMNGREIQVWFQNKRQAIRRAQGAYPLCEPMSDRAKSRLSNEQLFGIKLDSPRHDQKTPPGSFTSPEDSSSSQSASTPYGAPHYGLTTPKNSANVRDRRARLVLSDVGDGHAELMFSPTPLKPSSPPRVPALITPIRTPLSRKIAARSASSPALLALRTPNVRDTQSSAMKDTTNVINNSASPSKTGLAVPLSALRSLKRPHSFVTTPEVHKIKEAQTQKKRQTSSKAMIHRDIGRGKENIPPPASFPTPRILGSSTDSSGDSYGRDIRRIQSENLGRTWPSMPVSSPSESMRTMPPRSSMKVTRTPAKDNLNKAEMPQKKMSAEECALSLVSLAHGS